MKLLLFIPFFLIALSLHPQDLGILLLQLAPGDSFVWEINETSDTEQYVMGEEQKIKQIDDYTYVLDVLSISENGNIKFKATYKHFSSVFDRDNYIDRFDTDSLISENNIEANYFKSLAGKSFLFEVDRKGHVLSFSGLENIFKTSENIEIDSVSANVIQKKFAEESIQNILFAVKYPKHDSLQWHIADTFTSGILYIQNNRYSLKDKLPNTYEVLYHADIFTNSDKNVKAGNVFISYELAGKLSGIIEADKETGFMKSFECKRYIEGSAGMKYSPNSDHAYTWPIKITNTVTCKVNKIK